MPRLKKRDIDAAKSEKNKTYRLWDDDPRGLGLYVKPSGVKSFFVQYRSPTTAKKRRYTIGNYGIYTLDQARKEAKNILKVVADGEDPLKIRADKLQHALDTSQSVANLCDDYMKDAWAGLVTYRGVPKKESTLKDDHGRIERHIKPLIGNATARDITKRDIERVMNAVRTGKTAVNEKSKNNRGRVIVTGGPTAANRVVSLLGSIFTYAIKQGIRDDNPVVGVEKPADKKRDRVLSPEEYKRLGNALDQLESQGANKIALRAFRVLALTGCRRGEIFGLKKAEIDEHAQCLRLADTKVGQQVRAISKDTLSLLTQSEFKEESEFVFPASHGDGHLTDTKVFTDALSIAKLDGVSPHTLRHSFASVALELEYSELTIAGLLGHRSSSITSRYAHHVDRSLVSAADAISNVIAARLFGSEMLEEKVISISEYR